MIQAGKAAFIGATVMHAHINPGATANDWLFIGLRPASSRPLGIIVPGQKELYTTADLTQIAPGAYTETLSDSRLTANGVDKQTGPSQRVVFVIDGSLSVSGDAGDDGNGLRWSRRLFAAWREPRSNGRYGRCPLPDVHSGSGELKSLALRGLPSVLACPAPEADWQRSLKSGVSVHHIADRCLRTS